MAVNPTTNTACTNASADYTINIGQVGTYTDPVTLSTSGLPGGATASFSVNPVTPTGSSTMTIGNLGGITAGTYTFDINTSSTSGPKLETLTLIVEDVPTSTTLLTPLDGAIDIPATDPLTWNAIAGSNITYAIEIATDPSFATIIETTSNIATTSYTPTSLSADTILLAGTC